MKNLIYYILIVGLMGCGPKEFDPPDNVKTILEKAGNNRAELEKTINHFKETREVIKEEAAYFLIGNMDGQGYAIFNLVDSAGHKIDFNVLAYEDYDKLLDGWDQIETSHGKIGFELDTMLYDYASISSEYLIQNIDLAFESWENNPWAQHLSFDQFCEYVLPYRSTNEPLEEWRAFFIKELSWVKDSLTDKTDPVEAACWVNDYIKSWFRFDPRYYEHPTDQGLAELLDGKMGRCEDMTNLAIYAMRALAIPVMSDFTPYWAKTGNNHAWNAVLTKNDSVIIFMGGESNPGDYKLGHELAKVYRKTFAFQDKSLASKAKDWEKLPPYLNKKTIKDVTWEYVPTSDLKIDLTQGKPDSTSYSYICVFNSGEWKAIDHGRIWGSKAQYYGLGRNVAYLPAFYYDEEIIPASNVFVLSDSGIVENKIPDGNLKIDLTLYSTTKRITKETTDFIDQTDFESGKEYILYYWNDKWIENGREKAGNGPLVFKGVPSNAIYWLVEEGSRKEERILQLMNREIRFGGRCVVHGFKFKDPTDNNTFIN
ncbi:MAG: transglutaminase-like domain-containing protein [Bacteroidales bacterium]